MALPDRDAWSPPLHRRCLEKPDGRRMWLYARAPIDPSIRGVSPTEAAAGSLPGPHLRWHPLRGEWVAYAGHRQHRTFLPQGFDPLAPTADPTRPTELPAGEYDVAVFENLFPTFKTGAQTGEPPGVLWTAPALGACEVVVFTRAPFGSLGALPLDQVELVMDVWADRTADLGRRPEIQYVFPFENRGVEIGVTLPHPHGQIYAYPFIPPVAARAQEQQQIHYEATGRGLLEDLILAETSDERRVLHRFGSALAFVPACARYPYEIWVAPFAPAETIGSIDAEGRRDLAAALKHALMLLDGLFKEPMPYIMAVYQAPTDGQPHPEAHVHIEIYPYLRMPGRLKYLAGSEVGAGVFTADTLPEQTAERLRAVVIEP